MSEYTSVPQERRRILLIVFIVLLLAINAVMLYLNFRGTSRLKEKDVVIASQTANLTATNAKLDSISRELELRITEVQKLGGDVESLMQIKSQLEADKASLAKDKNVSQATIRNYAQKIQNYETMLTSKDQEIERLKSVNNELYTQNTELKNQKNQLSDTISTYRQTQQKLQEKVSIASALKAENLAINALSEKGKERTGGEYRARQLDKIRVVFTLADNPVAPVETKNIYLRLIEPDGGTLYDLSSGSGTFLFGGKEMFYTARQELLFDNTGQQVSFIYNKGIPYKEGRHTVELYSDGYKIGQGSFVVK